MFMVNQEAILVQKLSLFMMLLWLSLGHSTSVQAVQNANHPSVKAALACMGQIAAIIKSRQQRGKRCGLLPAGHFI